MRVRRERLRRVSYGHAADTADSVPVSGAAADAVPSQHARGLRTKLCSTGHAPDGGIGRTLSPPLSDCVQRNLVTQLNLALVRIWRIRLELFSS